MDTVEEIVRRHAKAQQAAAAAAAAAAPTEAQTTPPHAAQHQHPPPETPQQAPQPSSSTPGPAPAPQQQQGQWEAHDAAHPPAAATFNQPADEPASTVHPAFRNHDQHQHHQHAHPQHHNGQNHSSQPPSPPSFHDPFVRQPNAQRRPSKQLQQRQSIAPHQQAVPPIPQNGSFHPDQQQQQQQPNQPPASASQNHTNPAAHQPRHSYPQQIHMNHHHHQSQPPQPGHRGSASFDRSADPGLAQGRASSTPSLPQPNYLPAQSLQQQGSYSRRSSHSGPAEPAYLPSAVTRPSLSQATNEPVTVFMEDFRTLDNGEPEHLLAEVVIPLRNSTTHDGFWANAQELVEQLQASPSRIDGPAKVFCRRGKYKHCFMRMSEGNDIECQPSSLQISPEFSIQIMIESHRSAPYHIPSRAGAAARLASPRPSVQHDGSPGQSMHRDSMQMDTLPLHHQYGSANVSPQMRTAAAHAVGANGMNLDARRGSAASIAPTAAVVSPPPHRKRSIPDGSPTAMAVDIDDRPTKRPSITSLAQGGGGGGPYAAQAGSSVYGGKGAIPPLPVGYAPRSSTGGGPLPPQSQPQPQAGSSSGYESYGSPPTERERTPTHSLSNPNSVNNLRDASNGSKDPPSPQGRNFEDGQWRAPRAQVNTAIANWLKPQIQREEGYAEFMHSKGHVLTVPQLLRVYGFAQRQILKWNNQRTPDSADGCPLKKIGKSNVLQALGRQTSWGSDCEQTLMLVEKYGPGGVRENERIVNLVSGKIMPGEKEGSVYFLSVLRDMDRDWRAQHEPKPSDAMDEDTAEQRRSSLESAGDASTSGGSQNDRDTPMQLGQPPHPQSSPQISQH